MTSSLRIDGGVAVITGAASRIGSGLVREALRRGMRVVAADVQAERLRDSIAGLHGEVIAVPTDVTDAESVEALARRAWQVYGGVDLLFNNAGIMATGFSWQIEPARWRRSFEVNVHGIHHGLRSFVPRLLAAGKPAHIVNTASVGGFLASPLMSPYSATKFAVVALTESLRGELEMIGAPVGASLLAPGPVVSGIFDDPFGAQVEPAVQQFVELMRGMLQQNGLTPEAFAQRVFEGVLQGQFWIVPQPEAFDESFRQKAADVLARRNPVLQQVVVRTPPDDAEIVDGGEKEGALFEVALEMGLRRARALVAVAADLADAGNTLGLEVGLAADAVAARRWTTSPAPPWAQGTNGAKSSSKESFWTTSARAAWSPKIAAAATAIHLIRLFILEPSGTRSWVPGGLTR